MNDQTPWRLATTTLGEIESRVDDPNDPGFDVAVIPYGCTEPHNLHLPYGTDTLESDEIGDRMCRRAWNAGARVALLPTIPYGTTTNQSGVRLTLNLMPSTLLAVTRDLVSSLVHHGIRRIVLLNSHGGNDLKWMLRELHGATDPPAHLFLVDWFRAIRDAADRICDRPDDHAGEMETSIVMAVRPDLVRRRPDGGLDADEGAVRPTRFEAVERGWVSLSRPWHLLTTNTGAGDPHAATPQKGEALLEVVEERFGGFLVELASSGIDGSFPFEDR